MLDYDLTRAEQVRRTDLAQKARRMILSHMKVCPSRFRGQ